MSFHYVWIGVRETDILNTGNLFDASITIFGSGENGNVAMEHETGVRVDHNADLQGYVTFVRHHMERMIEDCPDVQFIHYAPLDCKELPAELQTHFCFQNPYSLVEFFENKLAAKQWLGDVVHVLPFRLALGSTCTAEQLPGILPGSTSWIAQGMTSCGGNQTFLIDGSKKLEVPASEALYSVSAYQEQSVSANFHAVIFSEEVVLFPPSMQIIDAVSGSLHYRGADFSVCETLTPVQRTMLEDAARKICTKLQSIGYLGVCGVDLLLTPDGCYFMEVNPRFQASTFLLNRGLTEIGLPCVQEYHMQAFSQTSCTLPLPRQISGSFYSYENTRHTAQLRQMHVRFQDRTRQGVTLLDDGLDWTCQLEKNAYLFKLVFDRQISCVTVQHTLRLHPNLQPAVFPGNVGDSFRSMLFLKILLLTRGVSVSAKTWCFLQLHGGADWEEFEAINLLLPGGVWVSAACRDFWSDLSPLQLEVDSGQLFLSTYGDRLMPVQVQAEDLMSHRRTSEGHAYSEIAYLNPDRLRIFFRSGCAMQACGQGCRFCDLYGPEYPFTKQEIYSVLNDYLSSPCFRHILISGGSDLSDSGAKDILALLRYIRARTSMSTYLMSTPIASASVLRELYDAGLNEIAFNIEVFDRQLAQELMPGKGQIPLKVYEAAWREAVALWGRGGAVRSAVLLGFESLDVFAAGIRFLCAQGVAPMLSVFRQARGTDLEHYMPPDEHEVLQFYEVAQAICREYALSLGPTCPTCQNNTVQLTIQTGGDSI